MEFTKFIYQGYRILLCDAITIDGYYYLKLATIPRLYLTTGGLWEPASASLRLFATKETALEAAAQHDDKPPSDAELAALSVEGW